MFLYKMCKCILMIVLYVVRLFLYICVYIFITFSSFIASYVVVVFSSVVVWNFVFMFEFLMFVVYVVMSFDLSCVYLRMLLCLMIFVGVFGNCWSVVFVGVFVVVVNGLVMCVWCVCDVCVICVVGVKMDVCVVFIVCFEVCEGVDGCEYGVMCG